MNVTPSNTALPDEVGQRISAYLDGELSAHEAAEVERLLADDPVARRFADELRAVSGLCHSAPAPVFATDLSKSVVAEALRRQATGGRQAAGEAAEDLAEPESYYGLPLGKSSRSWGWAVVAAAAAVMIGFYGRPEAPKGRPQVAQTQQQRAVVNSQQLASYLRAVQQSSPGMQLVNYQTTPERYQQLRQRLAFQPVQRAQLPGALMAVSEPAEPAGDEDQLVYLEGDEAELDRLLGELDGQDGSLVKVAPDQKIPTATPKVAPAPMPTLRAVPLRVTLTPEQIAALIEKQKQANPNAPQRRFIVLRIKVTPKP